jgi:hypothetical protein
MVEAISTLDLYTPEKDNRPKNDFNVSKPKLLHHMAGNSKIPAWCILSKEKP